MITIYIPGLALKSYEYRRGDAQIIHDGNKHAIIIDGGEPELCNKIVAYCHNQKITNATYILTHWHIDHDSGMKQLLESDIIIDGIYCPPPPELKGLKEEGASDDYARACRRINLAKSLGKTINYPEASKPVMISVGEIRCRIWRRKATAADANDREINNSSLCTYFPDLYYLTTGDTINSFDIYLKENPGTVKVFKIPHHGNACTTAPCDILKSYGAKLCWYNDFEKKGSSIGSTSFSKWGAGYCKNYFTTLRTDSDIIMTAAKNQMKVQKNDQHWQFKVPYGGDMPEPSWEHGKNGWWYRYADGTYAVGWAFLPWSGGKNWFYFDKNGWMLTGWIYSNSYWYYCEPSTGVMATGWLIYKGKRCYLEPVVGKNQGHAYCNQTAIIDGKMWKFDKDCYATEVTNLTVVGGNSMLVSYTKLSPNNSGKRTHNIDRITPHCVVGQLSVEQLGKLFAQASYKASCNYAIGSDGRVLLCVDEDKRSWCSSSEANDQRAVTIECASDKTSPYAFNTAVYNKLIDLCVDICERNGKKKLLWLNDKAKTLAYTPQADEMVLTVHRWFASKSCPGDWMYARMGDLANKVTARLSGQTSQTKSVWYRVRKSWDNPNSQIGAFKSLDSAKRLAEKNAGYHVYDDNGNEII